MRYHIFAAVCLGLGVALAGMELVEGQSKAADERPDEKEDKPLTKEEFEGVMDNIQSAWNRLKRNGKKSGDKDAAAKAADEIAEAGKNLLRYDGEVLKGDNKGKKAREQKDYKEWVEALEEAAKDYAKHAKKGDWAKADKAREKINETCGNCHDEYEPE